MSRRLLRRELISRLALLSTVALSACNSPVPPETPLENQPEPLPVLATAIVSNPVTATTSASTSPDLAVQGTAAPEVVYVSLPPGTIPDAIQATVRNPQTSGEVSVPMLNGGFDPVAMTAAAGDTLELDIQLAGADAPLRFAMVVPTARPPSVVRTDPPPKKRDVPLTAAMVVVFSEPIDPTTITPQSVRLLVGGAPVAGAVAVDPDGLRVEFQPTQPMMTSTDYQLVVTTQVTDLTGDPLPQAVTAEFTTTATADVTPPVVTLLSPADGDTVPLGFTTFRIGVTDDQNLPNLLVEIHSDDGEYDVWMGDQTNDFADLIYGIFPLTAGPHTIQVVTRDAAGNKASTAPATITVVDPDTASRIIIRSFSVVEFQYEEYPGQWYYAPQLVAAEAPGGSGLEIVGFEMLTIPGLPSSFTRNGGLPRPAPARSLTVPPGADVQLFEHPYGYPLDYYSTSSRSLGSPATGRLIYRDAAGHLYAATVQGPIVSGPTEGGSGWYCGHWPPPFVWPSMSPCSGSALRSSR